MKKVIIILSVIFMASCTKMIVPTQSDADRGSAKFSGLTVAQLEEGRAIFKHKCAQCHLAKKASSRDEEEWKRIVPQMAEKAARKKNKKQITGADQEMILRYIITMSNAHKK